MSRGWTDPGVYLRTGSWKARHSAWLLAPILGLGLLGFLGFLYVALRMRTRKAWLFALAVSLGTVMTWIMLYAPERSSASPGESDGVSGLLMLGFWISSIVAAFVLNSDYLTWRAERAASDARSLHRGRSWADQQPPGSGPALVGDASGLPPGSAQPYAGPQQRYPAPPGGYGSIPAPSRSAAPPVPVEMVVLPGSSAVANPLDVNRASATELARGLGVDLGLATQVVELRSARGGFKGLDQLIAALPMQPHQLDRFRDGAVFGPVAGLPGEPPPAGRVLDH